MNLYLRLIATYFRAALGGPVSLLEEFVSHHMVWPADLDIFGHVNNGRYFTITDLARTEMLVRAGIWRELRDRGLYPVLAGETIQFRKSLTPFQRYQIRTRLLGWDERFFYVEHVFESKGEVYAVALMKISVVGKGRPSPAEVMMFVEEEVPPTQLTEVIEIWNRSSSEHWKRRKSA